MRGLFLAHPEEPPESRGSGHGYEAWISGPTGFFSTSDTSVHQCLSLLTQPHHHSSSSLLSRLLPPPGGSTAAAVVAREDDGASHAEALGAALTQLLAELPGAVARAERETEEVGGDAVSSGVSLLRVLGAWVRGRGRGSCLGKGRCLGRFLVGLSEPGFLQGFYLHCRRGGDVCDTPHFLGCMTLFGVTQEYPPYDVSFTTLCFLRDTATLPHHVPSCFF